MAMGASMSGSRAIWSWVVKTTPKMAIIMTASRVVTLCLMQNFAVLMGTYSSPETTRTASPSDR